MLNIKLSEYQRNDLLRLVEREIVHQGKLYARGKITKGKLEYEAKNLEIIKKELWGENKEDYIRVRSRYGGDFN